MAVQNYWGNQSYAANQQQAWAAPSQSSWGGSSAQAQPKAASAPAPANWGQWQQAPQGGGGGAAPASSWGGGGGQPAFQGTGGYAAPQGAPSRTGGGADPYSQMAGWYQQYLGRTPSRAEMDSYLQHGTSTSALQTYQQQIQASQEAAAYQAAQLAGAQQGGLPPSWWQQGGGYPGQQGGGGVPGQPATGNFNTDGYPRPNFVPQARGGPMPGWEASKWGDPNHQTPKYVIGRILSNFSPRTENMDQVVAAIAQAYPGTRRTGSGDITVPGIGSTDILRAADVGGKGWQFLGQGGGGGGGGQQTGGYPQMDYQTMLAMLMGGGGQPMGPQQQVQQAAPQQDNSQYMRQIQQLQTQLAELQSGQNRQRGLNVTYF
jgi:hypothetical protein